MLGVVRYAVKWPAQEQARRLLRVAALLFTAGLHTHSPAQTAAPQPTLRIIGGLGSLNQFTRQEEPFWTRELARLTQGKYHAEIVPFDRAGVPGPELLRLMQLGVVPFSTTLLSSAAAQNPDLAAPDLAGLNPDMATLKRHLAAFRPYLQQTLRTRLGVELLAVYSYPAQMVFCKQPLASLKDLAGRSVRVSSASQADFVNGLGGRAVMLGPDQMIASVVNGGTSCAITGSMSGNTLGLHEVTSYIHSFPISWGLALFAANTTAWNGLPPDLRATLSKELPRLEAAIWAESERETGEGLACNSGKDSCTSGRRGRMQVVAVTPADEALRQRLLHDQVLPHWLQRCNRQCAALWNETMAPVNGIRVPETP